jgi:hypothetical protein
MDEVPHKCDPAGRQAGVITTTAYNYKDPGYRDIFIYAGCGIFALQRGKGLSCSVQRVKRGLMLDV